MFLTAIVVVAVLIAVCWFVYNKSDCESVGALLLGVLLPVVEFFMLLIFLCNNSYMNRNEPLLKNSVQSSIQKQEEICEEIIIRFNYLGDTEFDEVRQKYLTSNIIPYTRQWLKTNADAILNDLLTAYDEYQQQIETDIRSLIEIDVKKYYYCFRKPRYTQYYELEMEKCQ